MNRGTPIYLDYQATTPLDPDVRSAMLPYLDEHFGNPHSEHLFGWEAAEAVTDARGAVADLIGADPGEIILTSGATEANNLAVLGVAERSERRHLLTSTIEHKSILAPMQELARRGWSIEQIPVGASGVLEVEAVACAIRPETALVSIMAANNEIGTLQPIAEIGALCSRADVVFHCDAAQLAGKRPLDVTTSDIDLLSLSAHKFYGPKSIGALYIAGCLRDCVAPILHGGSQQEGMRSGTLSPLLCAGLTAAARKALARIDDDEAHTRGLRSRLLVALSSALPNYEINGDPERSLSGCLNIRIPGVDAHTLLMTLQKELAASVGSACNAGLFESSYVLAALGLSHEEAGHSLRLGFGRFTTVQDIDQAALLIADKAPLLRHQVAAE